jgi:DNA-binding CsgD family transcriptional regulator
MSKSLTQRKAPKKSDHARIVELFDAGLSDKDIAAKLGYSSMGAVRATRAKLGLRRPRRKPIDLNEIKRLFAEGKREREIAEAMGYSQNYIHRLIWQLYLRG